MFLFISGLLIAIVTFPGVILHEWAHKFFCELTGLQVYEVKYFQFRNPTGYVKHSLPAYYRQTFLVTIAPFLVNSIFAIFMFVLYYLFKGGNLSFLFAWLGFSFGMNAFPSKGDANNLWNHSKEIWRESPVAILGFPVALFIKIANLLRIIWFDAIYTFLLFAFVSLFF